MPFPKSSQEVSLSNWNFLLSITLFWNLIFNEIVQARCSVHFANVASANNYLLSCCPKNKVIFFLFFSSANIVEWIANLVLPAKGNPDYFWTCGYWLIAGIHCSDCVRPYTSLIFLNKPFRFIRSNKENKQIQMNN